MSRFIFTPELKDQVDEILAPLMNPTGWKELNLDFAKFPSSVVRMEGPPGSGKSALSDYMARQFKRKPVRLSFDMVASQKIGVTEQAINSIFQEAEEEHSPTIIMEECDAILWSRDMITDNTYVLGFVNTLLTNIDRFIQREIPSLLILTTNYPKLLDKAMESRITDVIQMPEPCGDFAKQLWKSKLPKNLRYTEQDLDRLISHSLTPREIEQKVKRACRKAFAHGSIVTIKDILK